MILYFSDYILATIVLYFILEITSLSYRFKNPYMYAIFKSYKSLVNISIAKNNLRQIL